MPLSDYYSNDKPVQDTFKRLFSAKIVKFSPQLIKRLHTSDRGCVFRFLSDKFNLCIIYTIRKHEIIYVDSSYDFMQMKRENLMYDYESLRTMSRIFEQ